MSKILRAFLILSIAASFWLPRASDAEAAAWHSPNGQSNWTTGEACPTSVEITAAVFFDEYLSEDFTETKSFTAYIGPTGGSEEPQKVTGPIPRNTILIPVGSDELTVRYVPTEFRWENDENQTEGSTNYYAKGIIPLPNLAPGTTVLVKLTEGTGDYFLVLVKNCSS